MKQKKDTIEDRINKCKNNTKDTNINFVLVENKTENQKSNTEWFTKNTEYYEGKDKLKYNKRKVKPPICMNKSIKKKELNIVIATILIMIMLFTVFESHRKNTNTNEIMFENTELYKLKDLTYSSQNSSIIFTPIYSSEHLQNQLRKVDKKSFINMIDEGWIYSDDINLYSPIDSIKGKSNCQGITLLILEYIEANQDTLKNITRVRVIDKGTVDNIRHMYLEVETNNKRNHIIDLSKNKYKSIKILRRIL